MRHAAINFADKLSAIDTHWSPRVIAELNDYQFKLVKVRGEFVWHEHPDSDEAFVVLDGELTIRFRDGKVRLRPGEMYVVPKGTEHLPCAERECQVLLVEPRDVVNTGGAGGDKTAPNDVWV